MAFEAPPSRGRLLITKAANALGANDSSLEHVDPDGLRFLTQVSVRAHWFVIAVLIVELVYRPYYGVAKFTVYALLILVLTGFAGWLHYRIRANRTMTWHLLLALYTLDAVGISVGVAISNGFSHPFFHLFYYPLVAAFAVLLPSLRLTMAVVTIVSVVYAAISLTVGDGLNLETRDEKALLARIAVMYAGVIVVNMASRYERMRRGRAVERERALERERIELSQTIHDTTAQSAYMIGIGIDAAKALAGEGNPELTATLEETSRLSRSTIWGLRHPINKGGIYEGQELGRALRSHVTSFTSVTDVPAELTETGVEPPLPVEARGRIFSIAHNALTNAYRHAEASRVLVELDYSGGVSLSPTSRGAGP